MCTCCSHTFATTGILSLHSSCFHFIFDEKREEERSEVCWHALKDKHTRISTFPSPFLVEIDFKVEAPQSMSLPPRAPSKAHFKLATSGYSRRRRKQKFLAFTFIRYCHSDCEENFSTDKVATELFREIAAKTIDFIFQRQVAFALDFKAKKFLSWWAKILWLSNFDGIVLER